MHITRLPTKYNSLFVPNAFNHYDKTNSCLANYISILKHKFLSHTCIHTKISPKTEQRLFQSTARKTMTRKNFTLIPNYSKYVSKAILPSLYYNFTQPARSKYPSNNSHVYRNQNQPLKTEFERNNPTSTCITKH